MISIFMVSLTPIAVKHLLSFYLFLLITSLPAFAFAQTAPASKTYTYLIYHKLALGLTIQDALSVEREWRAINQAAVDEGNLVGWHMMVKQMTSNPNPAEYDYVTCIVSREMAIRGASPGAMARLYGDSVQTRMTSLQARDRQTAPVVKIEIWENIETLFGPAFRPEKGQTVVVDFLKLRDAQTNWPASVTPLRQDAATQVVQNQLRGWAFSALVVPKGSEKTYDFATARPIINLKQLGTITDPKQLETQRQLTRTFDPVRQEVFRFEEFTTPVAVTKK